LAALPAIAKFANNQFIQEQPKFLQLQPYW